MYLKFVQRLAKESFSRADIGLYVSWKGMRVVLSDEAPTQYRIPNSAQHVIQKAEIALLFTKNLVIPQDILLFPTQAITVKVSTALRLSLRISA